MNNTLKAPPSTGADWEPAPEGVWPAICIDVFLLTKQMTKYGLKDQLWIMFQLSDDAGRRKYTDRDGNEQSTRFGVKKNPTFTMGTQGHLLPFIESWRGRKFKDQKEKDDFEFENVVGQQCQIQVVWTEKKDSDGHWANIDTIIRASADQGLEVEDYIRMCDRKLDDIPEKWRDKIVFTNDKQQEVEPLVTVDDTVTDDDLPF